MEFFPRLYSCAKLSGRRSDEYVCKFKHHGNIYRQGNAYLTSNVVKSHLWLVAVRYFISHGIVVARGWRMKRLKSIKLFFLLIVLFPMLAVAGNPGSNYGCLVWNSRFYVNSWYKTDTAPGNPYWGPHEYYDAKLGQSYSVVDNGNNACGTINPYTGGSSTNGSCFVLVGNDPSSPSSYSQGEVRSYTIGSVTPCPPATPVPLDSNTLFLVLASGIFATYMLGKRNNGSLQSQRI